MAQWRFYLVGQHLTCFLGSLAWRDAPRGTHCLQRATHHRGFWRSACPPRALHRSHDRAFPEVTDTSGKLVRADLLVLECPTCAPSTPHLSFLGCWDTSLSHLCHEKCSIFNTWCLTRRFEANFLGIATLFLLWMVEDFPLYSSIFNWTILRRQLHIMTRTDLGAQFDEFWQMYPPHATKP